MAKKNVLFKRLTVDNECHELKEDKDMPNAECPRYDRYSVENYMKEPQNAGRKIFPSNFIQKKNSQKEGPSYGASHVDFSDSFQCVKCDNRYYHVVNNFLFNEKIIVFKSNWIYNEETKSWEEFCWGKKDMQATYNHEKKHISNARNEVKYLLKKYMYLPNDDTKTNDMDTFERCIKDGDIQMDKVLKFYRTWNKSEKMHNNPESPIPSKERKKEDAVSCDE